ASSVIQERVAGRLMRITLPIRQLATRELFMTSPIIPLKEFDQEMATTRRALERVPSDKGKWKPHEKSFSIGHLAQLLAWMPGWIGQTLRERELNLKAQSGYSYENTESLVSMFDKNVKDARAAISSSR